MKTYDIMIGENNVECIVLVEKLYDEFKNGNMVYVDDYWKSKYYDFQTSVKPKCTDGFRHYVRVKCLDSYLNFFIHDTMKQVETINMLNRCLEKKVGV
jgi:hypothetical protein